MLRFRSLSSAGPQLAGLLVRQQLAALFPHAIGLGAFCPPLFASSSTRSRPPLCLADTAITIVQRFAASPAGLLLATSPALLLAPEGMAVGAAYLLVIALSEGGALAVRFSCRATYDCLRSLLARRPRAEAGEGEADLSDWVVVPDGSEELAGEFEFLPALDAGTFQRALAALQAAADPAPLPAGLAQSVLL
jgi:hypothetical protein